MKKKKMISLRSIFAVVCFFCTCHMLAVPARPVMKKVTQPDGTTIDIILSGDERCHYYTTTDGLIVNDGANGCVSYCTLTSDMRLIQTDMMAHNPDKRSMSEQDFIRSIDRRQQQSVIADARRNVMRRSSYTPFPNHGTVRGLIILAEFQDVRFSSLNIQQDVTRMMNENGYAEYGATGSSRDYFIAQSHGIFTPDFDVVGPVTLPHDMAFYGANTTGAGQDKDAPQMIVDACQGLASKVDFSQYDYNNDGEVDLVFVIYAGYGEAQGGGSNTIWPHAWDIGSAGKSLRLNGKKIGRYACAAELKGYEGTTPDGIGTFCHEFSHCLGLPDIYDSQYSGLVGMGAWSLMDMGCYNNEARTPCGYSAYERAAVGWLDIEELTEPRVGVTLRPLSDYDDAYKIVSPTNPNEYFTLENRQQTGWDAYLPGHGLMIVHVDYNEQVWNSNLVNSAASGHAHIQIVPAGGQLAVLSDAAYPGESGNTSFTDWSSPRAMLYSGGQLNKPVMGIKETDGIVSFNFDTFVGSPYAHSATDVTDHSFTAHWDEVDNARTYSIYVTSLMTGKKILDETFSAFAEGTEEKPDSVDIGLFLDNYTSQPGWTGKDVYQCGGMCRLGSGSNGGMLRIPVQTFNEHNRFTLRLRCRGNKTTMNGIKVSLNDIDGVQKLTKSVTLRSYEKDEYWVFDSNASGYIELSSTVPAWIYDIALYNGDVESMLKSDIEPEAPSYVFTRQIDDVTGGSAVIDGLDSGTEYLYWVTAFNGDYDTASRPSNKIGVCTLGTSGVIDAMSDRASRLATVGNGCICLSLDTDYRVRVTDINGTEVYSATLQAGNHVVAVSPGLYIVSVGNSVYKFMVR